MARCYYNDFGEYRCYRSAWNDWVRWVVLAVIVGGFFLLFILCSCITARRRRRLGRQPFYGTGWAARPMPYGANNHQNHYYANTAQPAPPYSPPATQPGQQGYYSGANQDYYQQQHGVELQPPQPTYNRAGGDFDAYQPPPGPPPGKA